MPPILTKTRSALRLVENPSTVARFAREKEEPDERDCQVTLDREVWDDMGSPVVITVTVEPGDQLND